MILLVSNSRDSLLENLVYFLVVIKAKPIQYCKVIIIIIIKTLKKKKKRKSSKDWKSENIAKSEL